LDCLSYDEFVRAHDLAPFVSVKKACIVANVGHTKFYEQVAQGVFTLIPNGSRRNITAQNLYRYYLSLITAAEKPVA